jgi:predicted O-methyltransferase YrrM
MAQKSAAASDKAALKLARRQEFDRLRKQCRLRELALAAIFEGILGQAVPLSAINEETGHDNHAEMLYVIATAAHRRARMIFEFGTFLGRTTFHLAAACPDATVTTLDLPLDRNPWRFGPHIGGYYHGTPVQARIREIRMDSREFDTAPLAHTCDFVWVDGDHSYDLVRNDTTKAFELVAAGGAIMWHDFGPDSPELVRFFADFTQQRPLFRIRHTSVLLHLDGIDPLAFEPRPIPFTKALFKEPRSADERSQ